MGCVYIEMCTVLAGSTVAEMKVFFSGHGSKHEFRDVKTTKLWTDKLIPNLATEQDLQPLSLARLMCNPDALRRPLAEEVVMRICQFDSPPPYFCVDCVGKYSSNSTAVFSDNAMLDLDSCLAAHHLRPSFNETIADANEQTQITDLTPEHVSKYLAPAAEDADLTVRTSINQSPHCETHILEDVTENAESQTNTAELDVSPTHQKSVCVSRLTSDRVASRTSLATASTASIPATELQGMRGLCHLISNIDPTALPCPWPNCEPPDGQAVLLFSAPQYLSQHLRTKHAVHDLYWTRLLGDQQSPSQSLVLSPDNGALILLDHINNPVTGVPTRKGFRGTTKLESAEKQAGTRHKPASQHVRHSILEELPRLYTVKGANEASALPPNELPRSSTVPSYLLASQHRLKEEEFIATFPQTTKASSLSTKPLFVYGTLMFPTVLRARAESFLGSEGTYSPNAQRRLYTGIADWAGIPFALQNAAEHMTPAQLVGFRRCKDQFSSVATLERAKDPGHIVSGFLLFGISQEAMCCLDTLYARDGPRYLFTENADDLRGKGGVWKEHQLRREQVTVSIELVDGTTRTVSAFSYIGDISCGPHIPWDLDGFLSSKSYHRLTTFGLTMESSEEMQMKRHALNALMTGQQTKLNSLNSMWVEEELSIAKKLGIELVFLGDEIMPYIEDNKPDAIADRLHAGFDPMSPCSTFGFLLQAAAYYGHGDIVWALINNGADVNAIGGEYGCALVAAVVRGHDHIAKLLLREGANVHATGGRYVHALYQAVAFDDVRMAHILLEKGAWLTKEYGELLDLAEERGVRNMQRELEQYDVLELHRDPQGERVASPSEDRKAVMMENRNAIIQACLLQCLALKGTEGKWTGIKGVKLLMTAFKHGANPDLIDRIRPFIGSFASVQEFFRDFTEQCIPVGAVQSFLQPVKHTDPVDATAKSSRRRDNVKAMTEDIASTSSRGSASRPDLAAGSQAKTRSSTRSDEMRSLPYQRQRQSEDIICGECDGRGGRKGMEHRCRSCVTVNGKQSISKLCRECHGRGYYYSERNTCRACRGTGGY